MPHTRLCVLLAMIISFQAAAQKRSSFEKVTLEELQMKSYPLDSAASAVVLIDLGYFESNSLTFYRKMRVKILSKAGLEWGNWIFNTPSKGDFKVVTHNLVDGKIVSEKANADAIFNEEVIKGYEVYKVFAPNVMVGSVIDITYSFLGIPYEWRFQDRIPVVFSELLMEPASIVVFNKSYFGFQPIEAVSLNMWRAKNMPAFHEEPFMNTYSNYITKFEFQIESFGKPGMYQIDLSSSWRKVIDNLLTASSFGGVLNTSGFLNDFVKETKAKKLSVRDEIQVAYDYIRKNLKWNEVNTLFASQDLKKNFVTEHSGSSADINLSLIALLNKLDITTYPIVLSTRANGILLPSIPTISKLNYVIAYIQDDGIEMFLDATSPYVDVPGILPAICLNGNGLLVKKDNEQWFSLNKNYSHTKRQNITVRFTENGLVTGTFTQDHIGYGYLEWMEQFKSNNKDLEIQKNFQQKKYADIQIDEYKIVKTDASALLVKESMEVDLTDQLIDTGDGYIFNPLALFDYAANPFKSEERKYPVDLNFPREISASVHIQLPKGYNVNEIPETIRFTNADATASLTYLASNAAGAITFRVILKINKDIYSEVEYKDLRIFISEVVKKISAPIEINKT